MSMIRWSDFSAAAASSSPLRRIPAERRNPLRAEGLHIHQGDMKGQAGSNLTELVFYVHSNTG